MRSFAVTLFAVLVALIASPPVFANEQRDFPTSEPGISIAFLSNGPQSACVANVAARLPNLALSFQLFSNGLVHIIAATEYKLPKIDAGSTATIRVNSIYVFSKVVTALKNGKFYDVITAPIRDPMYLAVSVIREIAEKPSIVSVVADDAQMPSVTLPPEPELATALWDCFHYMERPR